MSNVTSSVFLKLLHCLGEKKVISQLHTGEIIIGWVGEKIIRDIDFYATFMRTDDYTILDINGGRIGIIQGDPRKGDIIKLDTFVEDELQIYVGNILKFTALPGLSSDSYAVKISSIIREE